MTALQNRLADSIPLPGLAKPLSPLVLGTMTFGDTVDQAGAARIFEAAWDAGITAVDTANGYAGGTTEEVLRPLLRDRREDVLLATKAGIPHPDAGGHAPLSAAGLRASLEGSLRRLGTDYIDLFYLHQPDRATAPQETLETIAALVAEGKIGALGASNFAAWQIAELNHLADQVGAPRPVVAQQLYNLLARRIEEEYVEFAGTTGVHTMVYNPLAGGLLARSHRLGELPTDGRFGASRLAEMYKDRYWNVELFDAVGRLSALAQDAGLSLAELSLRWLVSRPVTGSILLGGSKVEHFDANVRAVANGPLPDDLVTACDEIGAQLRGPMPAYNR